MAVEAAVRHGERFGAQTRPHDHARPQSRTASLPSDAAIFQRYWIVHGGKRGALTRTAEECHCSLTHVARVLSRHAPKAVPRGVPVQVGRSDLPLETYVAPEVRYSHVPGLTKTEITRDARLAADACLAGFVVMTWLAVWLCWVPYLNGVLGGAALLAGHLAADAGRMYREARA